MATLKSRKCILSRLVLYGQADGWAWHWALLDSTVYLVFCTHTLPTYSLSQRLGCPALTAVR